MKHWFAGIMIAAVFGLPAATFAQGIPGSLGNLAVDSKAPIHIESDTLEIDEPKKLATFSGSVRANQDKMLLTTDRLLVNYVAAGGGSSAQLRTIDALGNVVVRVDDQVATGDKAHYDLAKEEVTLSGGVVLSQGENVVRGQSIVIDLTTSRARVLSASPQDGERVRMVVTPNRK